MHSFNTYLIISNKSNTKLHYIFVFLVFEKKYNDPNLIPPSCRYVQPHLRTLRAYPPENIWQKARLIAHITTQKIPKETPGDSFTKIRDPSDVGSSLSLEHASKEAKRKPPSFAHFNENHKDPQEALQSYGNSTSSRRALTRHVRQRCPTRTKPPRQWWYHTTTMCSEEEVWLWNRVFHLWSSDKNTPLSSYCSLHKSPQARGISIWADWSLQDMSERMWNRTSNPEPPRTSTTFDWSRIPHLSPTAATPCHDT